MPKMVSQMNRTINNATRFWDDQTVRLMKLVAGIMLLRIWTKCCITNNVYHSNRVVFSFDLKWVGFQIADHINLIKNS